MRAVSNNSLLGVLLVVFAFNSVDSLALGLSLQSIKLELSLSDTQLGVMSGIAFALFYSFMGIPIARWADRGNRVTIISIATAVWSVAVALCGMAGSFAQLLVVRIGVAVGEAACVPTSNSLIADYFDRSARPRATAVYMLGSPLGAVLGYCIAGWINQFHGWRMMFVIIGLPGLVLAGVARLTLKEPRQNRSVADRSQIPSSPHTLMETFKALRGNVTFRHLLFSFSVVYFFGYGFSQWQPAFFIRSYGLKTGELGTWFALIYGLGGLIGTLIGGEWASRYAASNERLQLKVIAVGYASFGMLSVLTYSSHHLYQTWALMGMSAIGIATTYGPLFATIQTLVPERMRAQAIAIIYLFANLIGLGLGPLAVGAISDALQKWAGPESLRYALLMMCPGYLWAAWHLWRARRTVVADLAQTHKFNRNGI